MKRFRWAKALIPVGMFVLGIGAADHVSLLQANAQETDFSYVRPMGVSSNGNAAFFFDTRSGRIWLYNLGTGSAQLAGRVQQLGAPLAEPELSKGSSASP